MMRLLYFIIIASFITGISCNTETPAFYLHKEYDFVIEAGSGPSLTYFDVNYNIDNTFKEQLNLRGLAEDQIKSISAGKGTFTSVFEDIDYDIIWDVSIWLISSEDPSYRKEIYYREQIPLNQNNELRLLSGLADLKEFLLSVEKYNLEIQLNFRNFVPANFETRFTYSFAIFTN